MNGLVVLAACVCAVTGQLITPGLAPLSAPSSQFHAQDEFGQFSFGHAGGPVARTEARNGFGVTTGGYQYIDANGLLQSVQYVSDAAGFRVAGTNLPVAPAAPVVAPLVAPTFNPEPLVAPTFNPEPLKAPEDTPEVKAAKAEHAAAKAAAAAAAAEEPAAERKRRQAEEEEKVEAAALPVLPYPYALGALGGPALLAGAPSDIVAKIDTAVPTIAGTYAAGPLVGAGLPLAGAYAGLPLAGAAQLPLAAAAPVAAVAPAPLAAPSREAIKTTVKLNPGHAIFYRID